MSGVQKGTFEYRWNWQKRRLSALEGNGIAASEEIKLGSWNPFCFHRLKRGLRRIVDTINLRPARVKVDKYKWCVTLEIRGRRHIFKRFLLLRRAITPFTSPCQSESYLQFTLISSTMHIFLTMGRKLKMHSPHERRRNYSLRITRKAITPFTSPYQSKGYLQFTIISSTRCISSWQWVVNALASQKKKKLFSQQQKHLCRRKGLCVASKLNVPFVLITFLLETPISKIWESFSNLPSTDDNSTQYQGTEILSEVKGCQ